MSATSRKSNRKSTIASRGAIWLAVISITHFQGCLFSEIAWSPNGAHLAFLSATSDTDNIFDDTWLFGGTSSGEEFSPVEKGGCELLVWSADEGVLALVDSTSGRMSSPAWSSDGQTLLYTRFAPASVAMPGTGASARAEGTPATGKLTLVRRYRDGHQELLHEQHGTFVEEEIRRLPEEPAAVSDNGIWGAFPWLSPKRLVVYSFEKKEVVAEIEGAGLPSFAPGSRNLAYHHSPGTGGGMNVMLVTPESWTQGKLALGGVDGERPVAWARGGGAFFTTRHAQADLAGRPAAAGGAAGGNEAARIEVVQVSVSDFATRVLQRFPLPGDADPRLAHASVCFDDATESLFVSAIQPGLPGFLESIDTETLERRVWHPFNEEVSPHGIPIGAPAASPARGPTGMAGAGRHWLAFRYGLPEWSAPIAIHDPRKSGITTEVLTVGMRMRALWSIAEAVRRVVRKVPDDAPSNFLFPAERSAPLARAIADQLDSPLDLFDRPSRQAGRDKDERADILRLTRHGLDLVHCGMAQGTRAAEASAILRGALKESGARRMTELELFFHYAREEYAEALQAAERRARQAPPRESAQNRLALECVRAQCLVALGREREARKLVRDLTLQRQLQLAAADGSQERRELRQAGVDLGARFEKLTDGADPILERLCSLAEELDGGASPRT